MSLPSADNQLNDKIQQYVKAATRKNTRRSYRSAVEHFEVTWGGRLPTTPDQLARYLVTYAETLSFNTLKTRLSALAQWHQTQGFVDPTKSSVVKKVLKGIRAMHPALPKQARPIQIEQLHKVDQALLQQAETAQQTNDTRVVMRACRDRALILIGFWRCFRSDELTRLTLDTIDVRPHEGMTLYLPHSKTDRSYQGASYHVPALASLCPVDAYLQWLSVSGLKTGPVFRKLDRWGNVSEDGLHPGSIPTLLRQILKAADIDEAHVYSSHSLRRGLATWTNQQGWTLHELMHYVGWKDMKSAMRYIEHGNPFASSTLWDKA